MADRRRQCAARRRTAVPAPLLSVILAGLVLGACQPAATSPPAPTASPTAAPASATARPSPSGVPTPTPEPALSLDLPPAADPRVVDVTVAPEVAADGGGQIVILITNTSAERVTELVLRWPTALRETLFLAPFAPSEQRLADGGPPLYQEWTKWVDGPGERGEPAGTTSLGWGPLDPGATLEIPILVTRRGPGAVAFDLQVLAGEAILALPGGDPAELRVEVPG